MHTVKVLTAGRHQQLQVWQSLSDKETYITQQQQVKNVLIISYMRGFVCQVEFQSWKKVPELKVFFPPSRLSAWYVIKSLSFTHRHADADGEAEKNTFDED